MTQIRISQAARLLGVSDDTVRRWVDGGLVTHSVDQAHRIVVDGADLADYAQSQAAIIPDPSGVGRSARNALPGLVTRVVSDTVMSQVELLCGGFRIVALMSTEAVRELGLETGSVAVAVVKATNVIVETPA